MKDDVLDYIRGGGSHFLSFADVPVVSRTATVGAALAVARDRGTQGVVVRMDDKTFHLLMLEALASFQQLQGVIPESVEAPVTAVDQLPLESVDMTQPIDDVRASFVPGAGLKVVFETGRPVGLISEAEDWESQFFQAPAVYACGNNHAYGPPPPATCWCGLPVA